MKKLFAIAIATVLSHAAFAAQPATPAPTAQPAKSSKACYKEVPVEEDNSSYNDLYNVGAKSGGFALVRVPCAAPVAKK